MDRPDERSVMTYVAQFVYKYPEVRSYQGESLSIIQEQYNDFVSWLISTTEYLSVPQHISSDFGVLTTFSYRAVIRFETVLIFTSNYVC